MALSIPDLSDLVVVAVGALPKWRLSRVSGAIDLHCATLQRKEGLCHLTAQVQKYESGHSPPISPAAAHPGDAPRSQPQRVLPQLRRFQARAGGVSPRDLEFLRDDEKAPIAYDESRKGSRLTDATFALPPGQLTWREVFSFSIARRLLERFEGTPLELDMRSVLAKIAESLEGTVSLNVESVTDQFSVLVGT